MKTIIYEIIIISIIVAFIPPASALENNPLTNCSNIDSDVWIQQCENNNKHIPLIVIGTFIVIITIIILYTIKNG